MTIIGIQMRITTRYNRIEDRTKTDTGRDKEVIREYV